jgi:hypothetical protein
MLRGGRGRGGRLNDVARRPGRGGRLNDVARRLGRRGRLNDVAGWPRHRGRLNDVARRPGRGSSGGAPLPRPLSAAVRGAAWCPSPPSAFPGRYLRPRGGAVVVLGVWGCGLVSLSRRPLSPAATLRPCGGAGVVLQVTLPPSAFPGRYLRPCGGASSVLGRSGACFAGARVAKNNGHLFGLFVSLRTGNWRRSA